MGIYDTNYGNEGRRTAYPPVTTYPSLPAPSAAEQAAKQHVTDSYDGVIPQSRGAFLSGPIASPTVASTTPGATTPMPMFGTPPVRPRFANDTQSDSAVSGIGGPAQRAADADFASQSAWNAHIAATIANMSGPGAAAALNQPLPQWNKAAGEAVVNAGSKQGEWKRLNTGYGSEIVGTSTTGKGKLNSFSGVGMGALPPGPAAVFGANGAPGGAPAGSYAAIAQHFMDMKAKADALNERGDIAGMLKARGITRDMARLMPMLNAATLQGHLGLEQQKAYAPINAANAALQKILEGDYTGAAALAGAVQGHIPVTATQLPTGTVYTPNSQIGQGGYVGFDMGGSYPRFRPQISDSELGKK